MFFKILFSLFIGMSIVSEITEARDKPNMTQKTNETQGRIKPNKTVINDTAVVHSPKNTTAINKTLLPPQTGEPIDESCGEQIVVKTNKPSKLPEKTKLLQDDDSDGELNDNNISKFEIVNIGDNSSDEDDYEPSAKKTLTRTVKKKINKTINDTKDELEEVKDALQSMVFEQTGMSTGRKVKKGLVGSIGGMFLFACMILLIVIVKKI